MPDGRTVPAGAGLKSQVQLRHAVVANVEEQAALLRVPGKALKTVIAIKLQGLFEIPASSAMTGKRDERNWSDARQQSIIQRLSRASPHQ